ncbi:MAG: AsmA-like C-terminal domain-containing protein [Pirellulaceae bacterium]
MMSKPAQPQPDLQPAGSRFHRTVRWFALLGLLLAAMLVAGRYMLFDELDDQIRIRAEALLKTRFSDCQVQVQSARRISGKGILLSGVSVSTSVADEVRDEPVMARSTVFIDELEIHCDADLSSLLQQDLVIERLIVRRAVVETCRLSNGSWLFPQVSVESSQQVLPPIDIEATTLRCRDLVREQEAVLVLEHVQGSLSSGDEEKPGVIRVGDRQPTASYRFQGGCSSDRFKQLKLVGEFSPATGQWQVSGTIESLRFSSVNLSSLPWELPWSWPAELELRCRSDVQWIVRSSQPEVNTAGATAEETTWSLAMQVNVTEGYVQDQRLPYPVTDIEAMVKVDSEGIQVSRFKGRCGTASMTGDFRSQGLLETSPWRLHAELEQLTLNRSLADKLSPKWRHTYDRFSPSGHVDVDLTLQREADEIHTNLKVQCQDTSFVYDRFPYPLEEGRGLVQWADGVLVIDGFQATAHGQLVRMDGRIEEPEKFTSGWVEISTAGPIPLDAPLLDALDEGARNAIVSLRPTGMVTLHRARFERDAKDGGLLHRQIDLELNECSIKPEKFPYSINRIRGRLAGQDGIWKFQEIVGHSGGAYVQCTGSWQQEKGKKGSLVLNVIATDVPLDTSLREAITQMNPRTGRVWEDLQPQGTLDRLTVQLRHPGPDGKPEIAIQGQKLPRQVHATDPGLMLKPKWFPYRIDRVTGMFNYRNGQIGLTGMRGQHGKSVIQLDGTCFFPRNSPWDVKLTNLTVDHLLADHELLAALPEPLRGSLAKLNVTGPMMLRGQLQLAQATEKDRKLNAQWDMNVEVAGATMHSGLRLDHIYGGVRLFGLYDQDGFRSRGELDVDSLYFRKEQLTHLQGPFWIDSRQVLFGAWSQQQAKSGKPRNLTAKSLGGRVVLDAQLITGANARFFLQGALQQGDLAYIVNQRGVNAKVSGKADATLQLQGTTAGIHTWTGRGAIRLRNADIYEVPLMVALLSLVSVRPPDTTAFTSSDISYRIQSDRIYMDRIQFNGDAISLEGNGWLDFDNKINLSFYTLVGRNDLRIPIISSLLAEASRNLLKIQVVGTLDKPKINGSAFPELDETMQNILDDLNRPRVELIERLPRTGGGD